MMLNTTVYGWGGRVRCTPASSCLHWGLLRLVLSSDDPCDPGADGVGGGRVLVMWTKPVERSAPDLQTSIGSALHCGAAAHMGSFHNLPAQLDVQSANGLGGKRLQLERRNHDRASHKVKEGQAQATHNHGPVRGSGRRAGSTSTSSPGTREPVYSALVVYRAAGILRQAVRSADAQDTARRPHRTTRRGFITQKVSESEDKQGDGRSSEELRGGRHTHNTNSRKGELVDGRVLQIRADERPALLSGLNQQWPERGGGQTEGGLGKCSFVFFTDSKTTV
ncbi:hypothetical protein EYF80_014855 [Liparis tanakae]|uniref:Uncharacterized protein n=1 Tax=Liparis tanakae TaxID=230148 RepID=A0A4Z2IAE9_9TELE|nr:hypothetical protein EYF80_014855 [Liparis tanakae]